MAAVGAVVGDAEERAVLALVQRLGGEVTAARAETSAALATCRDEARQTRAEVAEVHALVDDVLLAKLEDLERALWGPDDARAKGREPGLVAAVDSLVREQAQRTALRTSFRTLYLTVVALPPVVAGLLVILRLLTGEPVLQ